ncbi:MAG: hypothetical protein LRY71_05445 [Bacillaceae bacterium]|nr:hypothetical protein [Bacillaceae bacterium]
MFQQNKEIKKTFDSIVDTPLPKADIITLNMYKLFTGMRKDGELFNFFSSLFSMDYTEFTNEERQKIINYINKIHEEREND